MKVAPSQSIAADAWTRLGWYAGLAIAAVCAFLVRACLFDFESADYRDCLIRWYHFILKHGRFASFQHDFYNYTPPYLYLVALSTLLGLKPLYAIKVISIMFEAALATLTFCVVRSARPHGRAPHWAVVAILFFPTVVVNGSAWGQSDVIHATLIVLSLHCLALNRPMTACVIYGLALSFKLQSAFVLPAFIIFMLRGQVRPIHLMMIPWVYFTLLLPCVAAGRPLTSLLTIYWRQALWHDELTLNAPNIYQWLPDRGLEDLSLTGLAVATLISGLLIWLLYRRRNGQALASKQLFGVALLFAVVEPFLLPRMHERYFYLADVLSVVYAFLCPARWFLPICIGSASLVAYMPFLTGADAGTVAYAAVTVLCVLLILLVDFAGVLRRPGEMVTEDETTEVVR
jgi:Gpi18-like mannosyltransferase